MKKWAIDPGEDKMHLIWTTGVLGTVCAAVLGANIATAAAQTSAPETAATRLVILGTAAGRTSWLGNPDGGTSSALAINGSVYVIDFGRGWLDRFFQVGLGN